MRLPPPPRSRRGLSPPGFPRARPPASIRWTYCEARYEPAGGPPPQPHPVGRAAGASCGGRELRHRTGKLHDGHRSLGLRQVVAALSADRKSVVSGKSVSVRVDLGGRRIIKKKQRQQLETNTHIE